MSHRIARGAEHIPALRGVPVFKLVAAAEILLLAGRHVGRLDRNERHRFVELVRVARGRRSNLTPEQRAELASLLQKIEPRVFLGEAAQMLSPVRLPRRVVGGRRASR